MLALSRRTVAGISVVGAVSVLRDLDDLTGNAARVVAAAEALDESVRVLVELPDAPGWPAAAELVEAAGLGAQLRARGSVIPLVEQMAALVEADLPFSVAGVLPGPLAGLLLAVDALVETGNAEEAAALLTSDDPDAAIAVRQLSATRVRRRLLGVDGPDVAATAAQLGAALSEPGPADQPRDTPRR